MIVLQTALLGLGAGAILALLSTGLLVIYRGSGVLNLAHGAYAMFGGYFYWQLKQDGLATVLAIVATLVASGVIGLLTDQIVLRRLRNASALARLIATGGVLLLVQALVTIVWGVIPKAVSGIIPSSPITLSNATIPSDRLILFGIAAVVTGVASATWRYTRFGWIAEAVSDDERHARSLGWSPERVSGMTWAIGAALAGLAGVLIAPIVGLDTQTLPLLIVAVLAATLMGRFKSFWLAFAGATLIGVSQSLTIQYVNITGAADAIPLLIIIAGLVVTGSPLPLRGHITDRLPAVGSGRQDWRLVLVAVVAAAALVALVGSVDWQAAFASTCATAIILLSFVVVVGYTGQLSMAQLTIGGVAALVAARLMYGAHFPFWAALLAGSAAATAAGSIVAIFALRTRGVNLAVITLGMALIAQSMIFSNSSLVNVGGQTGIQLPSLTLFGWGINPVAHPTRYTYVTLTILVLIALAVGRLRRTAIGRMLLAVRDSERAASANTINVLMAKLLGFAIGGAIAGVGGILLAFQQTVVQVTQFDPISGVTYLSDTVIGGVGFVGGALFGSTFAPYSIGSVLTVSLQSFALYIPLISAVVLLITLMLNPHGWAFEMQSLLRRLRRKHRGPAVARRDASAPAATRDDDRVKPIGIEIRGVDVRYGGIAAVQGMDMSLEPGAVIGLIGPNGAGKTSFVDAVTGFERAAAGSVLLNGENFAGTPAYRRARAGIARSFQTLELYPDMTVLEHLLTGADRHDIGGLAMSYLTENPREASHVEDILRLFDLEDLADRQPDELAHGTRRLLGVARALAGGASIIMIDEPAAGLDVEESARFGDVIRRLARERGMTVLLIEHDMPFVMSVCDRIIVMESGRKISEGTPQMVQRDAAAIAAYLGEDTPDVTGQPAGAK